ncbi:MAG: hypothetical protein AAGC57_13785 [Pseudomonadota bacterium]
MSVLPFVSPSRLLVLYDDGVKLWGAVAVRRGDGIELAAVARAPMPDPGSALQAVLSTLRENGSVPRRVYVALDRSVLARVDFPISPDRPRSYTEMRELARWEAEPVFSDLPRQGPSEVLAALGRIGPNEIRAIEAEIADRPQAPGAPQPRLLDVAIEMGLIDRPTREAAMELVERLGTPPQETACAWEPLPVDPEIHPEGAPFPWLISAIPEATRAQWRVLCKRAGLRLEALLPGWGLGMASAGALLADSEPGERFLLLERHASAIFAIDVSAEDVGGIRLIDLSRMNETDALARLLEGQPSMRTLALGFEEPASAAISFWMPGAIKRPTWPREALEGLGLLAFGQVGEIGPPFVGPAEPGPPVYRNPIAHRVALVAALLLGIGGYEGWNHYRLDQAKARLADLDTEFERKRALANRMRTNIAAAKTLAAEATARETEVAELQGVLAQMRYLQERRAGLAVLFLDSIRAAAHSGLVLLGIEEVEALPEVFVVAAWAVDETGAERFISEFNANLSRIGLGVADESIRLQRGPQGRNGYAIRLRVAPLESGALDSGPASLIEFALKRDSLR